MWAIIPDLPHQYQALRWINFAAVLSIDRSSNAIERIDTQVLEQSWYFQ